MAKGDERVGKLVKCSFCGKPQDQVRRIVAGPGVYICDECVSLCQEIVAEDTVARNEFDGAALPKPAEPQGGARSVRGRPGGRQKGACSLGV